MGGSESGAGGAAYAEKMVMTWVVVVTRKYGSDSGVGSFLLHPPFPLQLHFNESLHFLPSTHFQLLPNGSISLKKVLEPRTPSTRDG